MSQIRPKNLNLFTIKFPLPAIVSILHRISGFVLVLLIPFIVWLLSYSLTEEGFEQLSRCFHCGVFKFFVWLLLMPFLFHLTAGIRHLLSDLHIGNSRKSGKCSSQIVFGVVALLVIIAGIWLW